MVNSMTTFSVIIPVPSRFKGAPVLSSLNDVDYPKEKIEIILAIGKNPSFQRNRCAEIAKGDILYFFDEDTRIERHVFKEAVNIFSKEPDISVAGGPDLTPSDDSYLQHLFGYAMSSYFAHWRMRARYSRQGKERLTDEKELILSNLAVRREAYLKARGFKESLYPNEENEFVNRISRLGYKLIYSPRINIYRSRRGTLFAFIRQFFGYGRGRKEQITIEGLLSNLQFFIPVTFFVYLLVIPFLRNIPLWYVPLSLYIFLALVDSFYLSFKNKRVLFFILPLLYMVMHISYAAGMLLGIVRKTKRHKSDCEIVHLKRFKKTL